MTVGENSSVFGPRSLLMNWKRFNVSFLIWFSSDTAEAMVFQMYFPTCTGNFFFLAAVDVGILHATMKNQVKICCKLTHFRYPRVAFLLTFMLNPYRNRELRICSFYSYINILYETNRYETVKFQWRHVSAPRHDCRQNTEWDLTGSKNLQSSTQILLFGPIIIIYFSVSFQMYTIVVLLGLLFCQQGLFHNFLQWFILDTWFEYDSFQDARNDTLTDIRKGIKMIVKKLGLQEYVCHICFKNIRDKNDTLDDIWSRIKKLAPEQSQWELPIPTQWMEVERSLQNIASKGRPIITYGELLTMTQKDTFNPTLFLKYMQASGFVLTIQRGSLDSEEEIVIDPQWLIDAFKQVIDFNDLHEFGSGCVGEIDEGTLSLGNAQEVWKGERFKDRIPSLLKFMEDYGLIAKPCTEEKFYYIPSLLDVLDNDEIGKWLDKEKTNVSKTIVLDFKIDGRHIPFPHFDKMMAAIISRQSIMTDVKRNCIISMVENEPVCFVLCHANSVIKITMFTKSKSKSSQERMLSGSIGASLRYMTIDISREIAARFGQHVQGNPLHGISCNPFPPLGDCPTSYITKNMFKSSMREKNCCRRAECNMVRDTDFQPWEGRCFTILVWYLIINATLCILLLF